MMNELRRKQKNNHDDESFQYHSIIQLYNYTTRVINIKSFLTVVCGDCQETIHSFFETIVEHSNFQLIIK